MSKMSDKKENEPKVTKPPRKSAKPAAASEKATKPAKAAAKPKRAPAKPRAPRRSPRATAAAKKAAAESLELEAAAAAEVEAPAVEALVVPEQPAAQPKPAAKVIAQDAPVAAPPPAPKIFEEKELPYDPAALADMDYDEALEDRVQPPPPPVRKIAPPQTPPVRVAVAAQKETAAPGVEAAASATGVPDAGEDPAKRRRGRRRRGRGRRSEDQAVQPADQMAVVARAAAVPGTPVTPAATVASAAPSVSPIGKDEPLDGEPIDADETVGGVVRRPSMPSRLDNGQIEGADDAEAVEPGDGSAQPQAPAEKRRRSRRGRRGRGRDVTAQENVTEGAVTAPQQVAADVDVDGADEEEEEVDITPGKIMLINIAQRDECRIAMLEEELLQEFYVERTAALSHVGSIYKGVVTNIEPSIQAAFVDFGQGKNGFLHISDLQPQYFPGGGEAEDVGRKTPRKERPPIQKCLRRNQEVIVQVTKEGIGTKGATLTTYCALPGRYLVMMPGMSRLGVSRKIEDEDARRRMRDVLNRLELPGEMGFILRTAGLDRTQKDLQRDLNYLVRLWQQIVKRMNSIKAPAELYQESDLVTRTLRDVVTTDVQEVLIDNEAVANSARQFLQLLSPKLAERVKFYDDKDPLFFKYGVEDEIDKMYSKRVPLPSGGSLVIESTEALVAIDVNSGKFREAPDPEESAFRINLEAADEIARQLSLRDLGGVIICDFIDMHMERHRREIERALGKALKKHKERAEILRMSRFGIIEMTRQRQRASIMRNMLVDCPHCTATGLVKSAETVMLEALRALQTAVTHPDVVRVDVKVEAQVAQMLLNMKRKALSDLEAYSGKLIAVVPSADVAANKITVTCFDKRGWPVQVQLPKSMMNAGGPSR